MSHNCQGSGDCIQQVDENTYSYLSCKYNCQLKPCPKCKDKCPEWVFDCNEGFCGTCAIELYAIARDNGFSWDTFSQYCEKEFNRNN